jgi:RND family efflux transporter MFP subunit
VNKGEELFTLSGKGLADNNILVKFNEAKTNFQISKSNYLRHQTLLNEKIISQRQFMETQSKYITDSIMYFALKESVGDDGMKIHAPITGYLHELNVSEGQFVDPGLLMATISTNKVLLLRADVPQQYFSLLQDIQTTNFRPAYSNRVYTLEELSGKLIAKGASVAENNHYMPVYFEVFNDGTLLEGAFAEFYLMAGSEPGHIVIPTTAVIEEQGNHYVYVQVTGEDFQKRAIDIVASNGLSASVTGIEPGERLVSEGAMLIKTATSAAIPSHNHQH